MEGFQSTKISHEVYPRREETMGGLRQRHSRVGTYSSLESRIRDDEWCIVCFSNGGQSQTCPY